MQWPAAPLQSARRAQRQRQPMSTAVVPTFIKLPDSRTSVGRLLASTKSIDLSAPPQPDTRASEMEGGIQDGYFYGASHL